MGSLSFSYSLLQCRKVVKYSKNDEYKTFVLLKKFEEYRILTCQSKLRSIYGYHWENINYICNFCFRAWINVWNLFVMLFMKFVVWLHMRNELSSCLKWTKINELSSSLRRGLVYFLLGEVKISIKNTQVERADRERNGQQYVWGYLLDLVEWVEVIM